MSKKSLSHNVERPSRQPLDARIAAAIRYLYVDCRASGSDLAHAVGLCESHFRRLFARQVGIAPSRFCLQARLDAASAGKSLKDAAAIAGYRDSSTFVRAFRSLYGVSLAGGRHPDSQAVSRKMGSQDR